MHTGLINAAGSRNLYRNRRQLLAAGAMVLFFGNHVPGKNLCLKLLADLGQTEPDVNVGNFVHGNGVVVQILIGQ
jgi:hypothetical protein